MDDVLASGGAGRPEAGEQRVALRRCELLEQLHLGDLRLVAQRRLEASSQRQVVRQQRIKGGFVKAAQPRLGARNDRRRAGRAVQERPLAEVVSTANARDSVIVDYYVQTAVNDDVEAVARLVLAHRLCPRQD